MALPFLPGQVFDRKVRIEMTEMMSCILYFQQSLQKNPPNSDLSPQIGKTKFHKSHQFDYRNDVSVYVGEAKSGIGKQ